MHELEVWDALPGHTHMRDAEMYRRSSPPLPSQKKRRDTRRGWLLVFPGDAEQWRTQPETLPVWYPAWEIVADLEWETRERIR